MLLCADARLVRCTYRYHERECSHPVMYRAYGTPKGDEARVHAYRAHGTPKGGVAEVCRAADTQRRAACDAPAPKQAYRHEHTR